MDLLALLTSPDKLKNRISPLVSELPEGAKRELAFLFGDRVTFEAADRYLHARDPSDLPRTSGPLPDLEKVLKTRPLAVVRPRNRGDLLWLLKFASRLNLPLVPRGGGTSTNGASVPAEGGITVDMTGFRAILAIDEDRREVDVEAGIHLFELEAALEKEGLTLRSYPVTAPYATVGGAIAANQAGYGSAEFGPFGNSVLEAELMSADGSVRTLRGGELDLAIGAEGSSGFLTRARIAVSPRKELVPLALAFPDLASAARAAELFTASHPVWSVSLYTPQLAEMRSEAGEKKTFPPTKHVLLLTLAKESLALAKDGLRADSDRCGGELLDEKLAAAEWERRFALWGVKRAGPSLLVFETILPIQAVAKAVPEILGAISTEVRGVHGIMVGLGEMLVTFFVPEDERRPEHATSLGEFFAIHEIARKFGGRPYIHGLLLAHEAERTLGAQHERILAHRARHDPWDLMNPGKMVPARIKGVPFVRVSTFFKLNRSILSRARSMLRYRGPEKEDTSTLGVHAAIAKLSSGGIASFHDELTSCSSCGLCNSVCPVFFGDPWESELPRGHVGAAKALAEGQGEATVRLQEHTFKCTLCGLCEDACPSKIPLVSSFLQLRQDLAEQVGPLPAHGALATNVQAHANLLGKPKADRAAWAAGAPFTRGAPTLLFAGCRAAYGDPAPLRSTAKLLEAAGRPFDLLGADESCCGHTLLWTGQYSAARSVMEANVRAILRSGAATIVTPDAECARTLKTHYASIARELGYEWKVAVEHASQSIGPHVKSGRIAVSVPLEGKSLFLPACMRSDEGQTGTMLAATKGASFETIRGRCCGAGAGVREAYPETAEQIAAGLLLQAKSQGAARVVTGSPICFEHVSEVNRKLKTGIEVLDAFQAVAIAAGLEERTAPAPQAAPKAVAKPATPAASAKPGS